MWGLYVLSGELGVSQAFLEAWYIGCCMDVSEVVVIIYCGKTRVQNKFP